MRRLIAESWIEHSQGADLPVQGWIRRSAPAPDVQLGRILGKTFRGTRGRGLCVILSLSKSIIHHFGDVFLYYGCQFVPIIPPKYAASAETRREL